MKPRRPMREPRSPERGSARPDPGANITPGHVRAFQMVTSGLYEDRIALWSCTVNGEPGVAIVLVDEVAPEKLAVMPLFVAVTPGMRLAFEGGTEQTGSEGEEGGGPERPEALRQFLLAAASLTAGGGS